MTNLNDKLPVEKCCDSIQIAWDKDMIGFFIYTDKKEGTIMTWNQSAGDEMDRSKTCVFCGKEIKARKR